MATAELQTFSRMLPNAANWPTSAGQNQSILPYSFQYECAMASHRPREDLLPPPQHSKVSGLCTDLPSRTAGLKLVSKISSLSYLWIWIRKRKQDIIWRSNLDSIPVLALLKKIVISTSCYPDSISVSWDLKFLTSLKASSHKAPSRRRRTASS